MFTTRSAPSFKRYLDIFAFQCSAIAFFWIHRRIKLKRRERERERERGERVVLIHRMINIRTRLRTQMSLLAPLVVPLGTN